MARLTRVERFVDIDVPRRFAYDHWTRFDQLPRFLEGVEEVTPIDERHVRWAAKFLGRPVHATAEILEQIPNRRIEWRSTGGAVHAGMVTFDPVSDLRTRLTVRVQYEAADPGQVASDLPALLSRRVEDGLQRFKQHVEARRLESGPGWDSLGTSSTVPPPTPPILPR